MPAQSEVLTLSQAISGHHTVGTIVATRDGARTLRYRPARFSLSATEASQFEPVDGWIWKQCTGDASATTFTFGEAMPPNVVVDNVNVVVLNSSGTAATTVAVGKSGTVAAYHSASSFSSSMATIAAKTTTVIRASETTSVTPIVTFSAAWDSGAKLLVGVHFTKLPATV